MPSLVLADFPLWFLRGVAVAFGLIWGSFLNVVIYRVPRGMSVVRPPSHCPGCGTENPPGAKFCIECGTALDGASPAPRAAAEPGAEAAPEPLPEMPAELRELFEEGH